MISLLVNIKKTKKYNVYIGRGSIYGNPYKIGKDGTREEVVEKYKKYFYKRMLTDKEFRDKVHSLKGKILGCYCAPDLCHGNVILEYLEKKNMEDDESNKNENQKDDDHECCCCGCCSDNKKYIEPIPEELTGSDQSKNDHNKKTTRLYYGGMGKITCSVQFI